MKMIGDSLRVSVRDAENEKQIQTDADANTRMRIEAGCSHHDQVPFVINSFIA